MNSNKLAELPKLCKDEPSTLPDCNTEETVPKRVQNLQVCQDEYDNTSCEPSAPRKRYVPVEQKCPPPRKNYTGPKPTICKEPICKKAWIDIYGGLAKKKQDECDVDNKTNKKSDEPRVCFACCTCECCNPKKQKCDAYSEKCLFDYYPGCELRHREGKPDYLETERPSQRTKPKKVKKHVETEKEHFLKLLSDIQITREKEEARVDDKKDQFLVNCSPNTVIHYIPEFEVPGRLPKPPSVHEAPVVHTPSGKPIPKSKYMNVFKEQQIEFKRLKRIERLKLKEQERKYNQLLKAMHFNKPKKNNKNENVFGQQAVDRNIQIHKAPIIAFAMFYEEFKRTIFDRSQRRYHCHKDTEKQDTVAKMRMHEHRIKLQHRVCPAK